MRNLVNNITFEAGACTIIYVCLILLHEIHLQLTFEAKPAEISNVIAESAVELLQECGKTNLWKR